MKKIVLFILALLVAFPSSSIALVKTGQQAETTAWIPYWRAEAGVASILPHLDKFTEVNPFVYTMRQDGTLYMNSDLGAEPWTTLRAQAKQRGILYIPTVMWANADAMDETFRDPAKRAEHVRAIVREVYARGFDGIDIDYEAKYARTKDYFSLFLKELYDAMGYDKWVMCTIESRTPLDSRYETPEDIPSDIEYANDFTEIGKYCDRVRFMAYDQGRFDLKLNAQRGDPYAPVADAAWVEKVMRLAAQEIPASKLVIGVPTYGYEYDVFPSTTGTGKMSYSRLWSFNPGYATSTAAKLGLTPTRGSSGELTLVFPASRSSEAVPLPQATRLLSWSDAGAIKEKTDLATKLGIRGVAIFKVDGGQDQGLWDVLATYRKSAGSGGVATTPLPPPSGGSASPAIPSRNLSPGSTGEEVRALQKLLNKHGYTVASSGPGSPGNETTRFGNATYAALVKFQKAKGITPSTGTYGPKTRAAFQRL
ncbi:hypothetical protein C4585_03420 [Candidatus Parcubacteria bacterium]|nr:MAG: hypothetical protein C4585_03420 [Candidatus Parcubacteria bacterium]